MDAQASLNFLDYWRIGWRARWRILILVALATAVSYAVALRLPRVYSAKATVLTPKESMPQSLGGMLLGGGGERGEQQILQGLALGLSSLSANQEMIVALLKSRTLREEIVAEFAQSRGPSVRSQVLAFRPDTKEKAIIGLTVDARDPQLAADIANASFTYLARRLDSYAEQATLGMQAVYRAQLERAAQGVQNAENELLKFQTENRFLPVDAATKGAVESVANLRGGIMALEMQREIFRMRFTDQHPQLRELEKQIGELKKQYSQNLFGSAMDLPPEGPTAKGRRQEFFVPTAKMTPIQFASLKLIRNLKIQEAFYNAALQGLHQIKYGEGRNALKVDMLDPAVPPSTPSQPNVRFIVIAAAISALVVGIFYAFIREFFLRLREQERQRLAGISLGAPGSADGGNGHSDEGRRGADLGAAVRAPALSSPTREA